MTIALNSLEALAALDFDMLIDVRSPAEFKQDHIPGAVSLPALSNTERAHVGTIYKQQSPFEARKVGAALVARNAAKHLETVLAEKPKGFRPLVYCWRGGQRSGSFASILQQIGWRADTVAGGYKTYRRLVQAALYETPLRLNLILLDGNTGTAKTALLQAMAKSGAQVLDLEALANHRGSVFGGQPGGQPHQKAFESRLASALGRFSPTRPVFCEAESNRVGKINLPPVLWEAMKTAPRIEIAASLDLRTNYLLSAYDDISADKARLEQHILSLAPRHSGDRIEHWRALLAQGQLAALAAELMIHHYDPRYARQRARHALPQARFTLKATDAPAIEAAAQTLAQIGAQLTAAEGPIL